jgi:hypothetical protein
VSAIYHYTCLAGEKGCFPKDGPLLAVSLEASSGLTPAEYVKEMGGYGDSRRQWGGFFEIAFMSSRFSQGHIAF